MPLLSESSRRRTASAQDEFIIELIKVEHIAATEMTEILQPFVSPGGDVVAYPRGNLIILVDLASNVERLRDLIAAFDTDTFRALHTQIYRIEHANVEDLGKELASILQPYGVTVENAEERGLYLIPLTRLNAIVVFGFNEEIFDQIEKWIRVLDVPPEKGGGRTVYVYAVENSKAADLAGVLGDLYGGGGGGGSRSGRDREGGQDADRGGGDSGTGLGSGGGGLGGRGSRGGGGGRNVVIEPIEGETPLFKEVVRIVADEISNSLIVLATPRDYDKIREVLIRLDVVPRQVLIEAIIAEIGLTGDLQFGIEYAFATGKIGDILSTTGGSSTSGALLQAGAKKAVNVGRSGLFSIITDQDHFISLINAVNSRSRVNILAAPHVIAADNREAHILIGEEVPILTSTQQSTLATANIVSSIQYRDTGTILTILPQVNSAGLVNMEIRQEVSDVGSRLVRRYQLAQFYLARNRNHGGRAEPRVRTARRHYRRTGRAHPQRRALSDGRTRAGPPLPGRTGQARADRAGHPDYPPRHPRPQRSTNCDKGIHRPGPPAPRNDRKHPPAPRPAAPRRRCRGIEAYIFTNLPGARPSWPPFSSLPGARASCPQFFSFAG